MGKQEEVYMSKTVGKFYIITRRCFYSFSMIIGMQEQKVFITLYPPGGLATANLRQLCIAKGKIWQAIGKVYIGFFCRNGKINVLCFFLLLYMYGGRMFGNNRSGHSSMHYRKKQ